MKIITENILEGATRQKSQGLGYQFTCILKFFNILKFELKQRYDKKYDMIFSNTEGCYNQQRQTE